MLPKYYINKIRLIYSISAIFAYKSRYAGFLQGVFRSPSCYLWRKFKQTCITWRDAVEGL